VFNAEAVVMVAEVGGCVGENGVEGSESKAIREISYRMDVDLEPCVVPLLVRPSEGVRFKRASKEMVKGGNTCLTRDSSRSYSRSIVPRWPGLSE